MDMIQVNHMKKTFGNLSAVNDISFSVKQGELFGFLGVNGAGKSTTINILCTLYNMTAGDARICGYPLATEKEKIRESIGVVFQENTLDQRLTVRENLFYRSYLYDTDTKEIKKQIARISELLEIKDLMKERYSRLSGGQKRRVEIARALLHQPKILFLDEPTTGLDPKTRNLVWKQIRYLKDELNMTIFLTTHYMEEAATAEHIVVIDHGRIIADATPFQLKEQFSCDKLRIETDRKEDVYNILRTHGLSSIQETNCLTIPLPNTRMSIPVLYELQPYIKAFEVVQGTMEEAFLTITGQQNSEISADTYISADTANSNNSVISA